MGQGMMRKELILGLFVGAVVTILVAVFAPPLPWWIYLFIFAGSYAFVRNRIDEVKVQKKILAMKVDKDDKET